jgi:phospholipid/cholesterol/gamma-HCH transport system substrate-binding protein
MMNNRVNFTLVGVFVSLVSILFFVGIYWIVKPTDEQKVYLYGLLVTESITGINIGTNVKYQGLPVGRVKGFRINPNNPREIMMDLEIRRDVPIQNGVMASIKPQGITGLSFIDIQVEEDAIPLHEIHYLGRKYKVIPFKPSLISSLANSASEITETLQNILTKVQKALEDNKEESKTIIHELARITQQLNKLLSDDNIQNTASLIVNTNRLVHNADLMVDEYTSLGKESRNTLQTLNRSIKNGDYDLKEIAGGVPEETVLMMRELRLLTAELSEVLRQFKENPNAVIFESTTPTAGPGESR